MFIPIELREPREPMSRSRALVVSLRGGDQCEGCGGGGRGRGFVLPGGGGCGRRWSQADALIGDLANRRVDRPARDLLEPSQATDEGRRGAARQRQGDPAKQPLKLWDGFAVKVETEGAWVTFGDDFRYWVSFK
jgi:hypothetical protein